MIEESQQVAERHPLHETTRHRIIRVCGQSPPFRMVRSPQFLIAIGLLLMVAAIVGVGWFIGAAASDILSHYLGYIYELA